VEFYDPDRICAAAPVRDNLLFGRVSYRVAAARQRVAEAVSTVVAELGLREDIERIGLDHEVGTAGRLLTAQERASINLVRCLVKKPDILVIDGALAPFDESRSRQMSDLLMDLFDKQSLFMVVANDRQARGFQFRMRFRNGQITTERAGGPARGGNPEPETASRIAGEVA
jgi:putative ABC transport system ATP-binding protein